MAAPHDDRRQEAARWIEYAKSDLEAARRQNDEQVVSWIAAFHAQQSAEKILKGYLVACGQPYPFTHDISLLLEHCAEHATWAEDLRVAEYLTTFATWSRYPGPWGEVSVEEAKRALELAELVWARVMEALSEQGIG